MVTEQNFIMWCVGSEVVTFQRKPFVSDQLAVIPHSGQTPTVDLKIATKGEWDVPLAHATYKFIRTRGFVGEDFKLRAPNGEEVPPSTKRIAPVAVPTGSQCAKHTSAETKVVCARCGTFCCSPCASVDLIHCRACLEKELAEQQKNSNASLYFIPAGAFIYLGGAIGAALGILAGAGAAAFAKRSESTPLKVLVATALYGLAAVAWLVIVMLIKS